MALRRSLVKQMRKWHSVYRLKNKIECEVTALVATTTIRAGLSNRSTYPTLKAKIEAQSQAAFSVGWPRNCRASLQEATHSNNTAAILNKATLSSTLSRVILNKADTMEANLDTEAAMVNL